MSLQIKKYFEEEHNSWQFEIVGELDLEASANFKDCLFEAIEEKKANIVIDCTNLSFIDSTGLGILIDTYKVIKKDNYTIYIKNPKKNINKLMNITGLNKLFEIS